MKQNERFLIYAVTGFLALILVVAVVFSREQPAEAGRRAANVGAAGTSGAAQGLRDLLPGGAKASPENGATPVAGDAAVDGKRTEAGVVAAGGAPRDGESRTGLPDPTQVGLPKSITEQPLMATPRPLVAADIVAQSLGQSRRDRNVRFVRARSGDSLDTLVKRWCGGREPFLAEAQSLNEDLLVLRVGQEVAVPWVDDEQLLAAVEAQKPKLLTAAPTPASALTAGVPNVGGPGGIGGTSVAALLGGERVGPVAVPANVPAPRAADAAATTAAAGRTYTIQSGDSLWRIAERTYGKKNAERMVGAIKQANAGLTEKLMVGKQIVLPKLAEAP
jgi:phage tail protein X